MDEYENIADFEMEATNGKFGVGIAASSDMELRDGLKLRYFHHSDPSFRPRLAATWAYFNLRGDGGKLPRNDKDRHACKLFANAAFACVHFGVLESNENVNTTAFTDYQVTIAGAAEKERRDGGGDFIVDVWQRDYAKDKFPTGILSKDCMQAMFSMIVASKLTWWATNHHTGGNKLSGYVQKMSSTLSNELRIVKDDEWITFVHTIGHWASTRLVLKYCNIPDIMSGEPMALTASLPDLITGRDVHLRADSSPAGTAKMSVVAAAARVIAGHPLLLAYPGVSELGQLLDQHHTIKEEPARFHIGSFYLTGQEMRTLDDTKVEVHLANLGQFLKTLYPGHSLTQSPALCKNGADIFKSYIGHSPKFEKQCLTYKMAQAKTDDDAVRVLTGVSEVGLATQLAVNHVQRLSETTLMSSAEYEAYVRAVQKERERIGAGSDPDSTAPTPAKRRKITHASDAQSAAEALAEADTAEGSADVTADPPVSSSE